MKKLSPFILIFSVLLQIFAPFSFSKETNNLIRIVPNKSFAETWEKKNEKETFDSSDWTLDGYKKAFPDSYLKSNGSTYTPSEKSADLSIGVVVDTGFEEKTSAFWRWWHVKPEGGIVNWIVDGMGPLQKHAKKEFNKKNTFVLLFKEVGTDLLGYLDVTSILEGNIEQGRNRFDEQPAMPVAITKVFVVSKVSPSSSEGLTSLNPGKTYKISLYYLTGMEKEEAEEVPGLESEGKYYVEIANTTATLADENNQTITIDSKDHVVGGQVSGASGDIMPSCSFFEGWDGLLGCLVRTINALIFKPTSYFFELSGKLMDFTLNYSLSDSSYRTPFVSEGWRVVRDLCNMFFIFILLYIAFTTILNTGGSKNKNTVINVVIIGIVINFSLFATHFIVDASNILARVFYNPTVIVIGPKDASGQIQGNLDPDFNHIKLSEAVVSKVNPQKLLEGEEPGFLSPGYWIVIMIMGTIVNVFGMLVFLSITLSFVGRVVGLWMAMVLSPAAFLTFTIPSLQNIPFVGWKKWWSETIKTAFMAPVFVFFMYLIVMFLESKLGLASLGKSNLSGTNKVITIIVPFIVIIILLKQAKKISSDMAGEVAGMVTKGLQTGAGFVAGAAMGVGGFAMKGTVGKIGNKIANSDSLKRMEASGGPKGWAARNLRDVGSFSSKSSFDVRNTKIGKAAEKQIGINTGTGNKSNYESTQEDKVKKAIKRADSLSMSASAAADQDRKSKEYKDRYEREMYAAKRAEGSNFVKANFDNTYEASHGPRVKNSEEINRERVKSYKETSPMYFADKNTQAKIDKGLGKKTKDEKDEKVAAKQNYDAEAKIKRTTDIIGNIKKIKQAAEGELSEINDSLASIVSDLNSSGRTTGLTVDTIDRSHIQMKADVYSDDISIKEAEIVSLNELAKQVPPAPDALLNLAIANREKAKLEAQLREVNSILERRGKTKEKISTQENIISNNEEIIQKEQETVDKFQGNP